MKKQKNLWENHNFNQKNQKTYEKTKKTIKTKDLSNYGAIETGDGPGTSLIVAEIFGFFGFFGFLNGFAMFFSMCLLLFLVA